MSCPRCSGSGVFFAYHKELNASVFAFRCLCNKDSGLSAIPVWENYRASKFVPEWDKKEISSLLKKKESRSVIPELNAIFSAGEFGSERLDTLIAEHGREFVEDVYKSWKQRNTDNAP